MRKKAINILCICLVASSSLFAQIKGSGSSVFHFLNLPASARLNALGGENVAIADDDISMAFINPALLTARTDKVLQLNYAYYLAGTMFGSAMYGHI
jgi:long-subunit fatty acid transport protein